MSEKDIATLMESPTAEDIALVTKAYKFAEHAHRDHKRFSGEPYFNHLYETAKILAELNMGAVTISAGFLHDCIEDVGVTEDELEKEFGPEVRFLVNGVTKLGKLKYRGAERHIESMRKLFVATSRDIRVIIIKLCDRLHNMRTLQYVKPEKQKRIALETLEIFAPIAYRLSIRKLSRELEDLSFPYIYPLEAQKTRDLLKTHNQETLPKLEKFMRSLQKLLVKEGFKNVKTDYRLKGLFSLHRKINEKGGDIDNVYDILALRIQVDTISECYRALGVIHGSYRPMPGRIKDYIAFIKPNGYQSLHTTVFTGDGAIVEVQIRTPEMHKNAEFGIASHISFKESKGKKITPSADINWFKQFLPKTLNFHKSQGDSKDIPSWIKRLGESHKETLSEEEMADIKNDFFSQRIFVFTPKGDAVDLPIDSTSLDFAYAIHSDIGNHTQGAKINGKLVSLDTQLHNGDFVEIITKKSSKPHRKWLDMVKTTLAKKHIKSALGDKF